MRRVLHMRQLSPRTDQCTHLLVVLVMPGCERIPNPITREVPVLFHRSVRLS